MKFNSNDIISKISIKGEDNYYSINSIFDLIKIIDINNYDKVDKKSHVFYQIL